MRGGDGVSLAHVPRTVVKSKGFIIRQTTETVVFIISSSSSSGSSKMG